MIKHTFFSFLNKTLFCKSLEIKVLPKLPSIFLKKYFSGFKILWFWSFGILNFRILTFGILRFGIMIGIQFVHSAFFLVITFFSAIIKTNYLLTVISLIRGKLKKPSMKNVSVFISSEEFLWRSLTIWSQWIFKSQGKIFWFKKYIFYLYFLQ